MPDKFVTINVFDRRDEFVNNVKLNVDSVELFTSIVKGLGGRVHIIDSFETPRAMEEEA